MEKKLLFLSLPEFLTMRNFTGEDGTKLSDFFLRKSDDSFTYRVKTRRVKKLFPELTRAQFAEKLLKGEVLTTEEKEGVLI